MMKKDKNFKNLWLIAWISTCVFTGSRAFATETRSATVFSVFKSLDMGTPGEASQKDFYIGLGSNQGVHEGSLIEVTRKLPVYDLVSEKLYKDMVYKVARLKVIHSESSASVARLEKIYPLDQVPALFNHAVMVGDQVKAVGSE